MWVYLSVLDEFWVKTRVWAELGGLEDAQKWETWGKMGKNGKKFAKFILHALGKKSICEPWDTQESEQKLAKLA